MAMTREQAVATALQLRRKNPALNAMPIAEMVNQIMAGQAPKLSPATPAPVQQGAPVVAPKPTADLVPATPTLLPDDVRQRAVQEAAPPVAAPAPPPPAVNTPAPARTGYQSRFRPALDAATAELKNLNATTEQATNEGKPVPPEVAARVGLLSERVNRLQGMVAAEEGAIVDTDRAALLDRQKERLTREEQLIEKARKRAPAQALMEFGKALAGAQKGESFTSAFARGVAAGADKYAGVREAGETAKRGIDERRDALTLQNIDALQKARDNAILAAQSGNAIDKETLEMASLTDANIVSKATQDARISSALSQAAKLEVDAKFAPLMAQAELDLRRAQTADVLRGPRTGSGTPGGKPSATVYNAIASQVKNLRTIINDPYTPKADLPGYKQQLAEAQAMLAAYGARLGVNPAPAAAGQAAPLRWDPKTGVQPNK